MMLKTLRSFVHTSGIQSTDAFKGCVIAVSSQLHKSIHCVCVFCATQSLSPCPYTSAFQVPACFSAKQRRAIVDAASVAGLNVLQVIDEATAGRHIIKALQEHSELINPLTFLLNCSRPLLWIEAP